MSFIGAIAVATLLQNPAAEFKKEVDAGYKVLIPLIMKKDFKKIDAHLIATSTKDFVYIEEGKSMGLQEMLKGMKDGFGPFKKISKVVYTTSKPVVKGNTASCLCTHLVAGDYFAAEGADRDVHKVEFGGVSLDSFRKEGGKWKMSKMEWKSQKFMMDGKEIKPDGGQ
jgi:hypothetical protein